MGASFGAVLSMWGTFPVVDAPRVGMSRSTYGFGDMYIKPFELGWHAPWVDAIAGIAFWIPTGRYSPGANNNTGQGQWGFIPWVAGPALKVVSDYERSLKAHPNPPAANATNFGRGAP